MSDDGRNEGNDSNNNGGSSVEIIDNVADVLSRNLKDTLRARTRQNRVVGAVVCRKGHASTHLHQSSQQPQQYSTSLQQRKRGQVFRQSLSQGRVLRVSVLVIALEKILSSMHSTDVCAVVTDASSSNPIHGNHNDENLDGDADETFVAMVAHAAGLFLRRTGYDSIRDVTLRKLVRLMHIASAHTTAFPVAFTDLLQSILRSELNPELRTDAARAIVTLSRHRGIRKYPLELQQLVGCFGPAISTLATTAWIGSSLKQKQEVIASLHELCRAFRSARVIMVKRNDTIATIVGCLQSPDCRYSGLKMASQLLRCKASLAELRSSFDTSDNAMVLLEGIGSLATDLGDIQTQSNNDQENADWTIEQDLAMDSFRSFGPIGSNTSNSIRSRSNSGNMGQFDENDENDDDNDQNANNRYDNDTYQHFAVATLASVLLNDGWQRQHVVFLVQTLVTVCTSTDSVESARIMAAKSVSRYIRKGQGDTELLSLFISLLLAPIPAVRSEALDTVWYCLGEHEMDCHLLSTKSFLPAITYVLQHGEKSERSRSMGILHRCAQNPQNGRIICRHQGLMSSLVDSATTGRMTSRDTYMTYIEFLLMVITDSSNHVHIQEHTELLPWLATFASAMKSNDAPKQKVVQAIIKLSQCFIQTTITNRAIV